MIHCTVEFCSLQAKHKKLPLKCLKKSFFRSHLSEKDTIILITTVLAGYSWKKFDSNWVGHFITIWLLMDIISMVQNDWLGLFKHRCVCCNTGCLIEKNGLQQTNRRTEISLIKIFQKTYCFTCFEFTGGGGDTWACTTFTGILINSYGWFEYLFMFCALKINITLT